MCVVPLSQPKSRDLDYPLWDVGVSEIKKYKEKKSTPTQPPPQPTPLEAGHCGYDESQL